MHPFSSRFIRLAIKARVPIVPVVFLGTHESHLLIEHEGKNILVNKRKRLRTEYTIQFLPPMEEPCFMSEDSSDEDCQALADQLRADIEAVIEKECEKRPLVSIAQHLQRPGIKLPKGKNDP
jgi:1-acyl-sn-glycerol-3-phosphate acyltransferase